MWSLVSAILFLTLVGSLTGLFFKRLRGKATWIALASFVGLVTSMTISGGEHDETARQKGFLSGADLQQAEKAGVADPAAWQVEKEKAKTAEFAAMEVKRVAVASAEARRVELLRQPPEQVKFIRATERGREQFENGQNDLQRGAARPFRANEICSACQDLRSRDGSGLSQTYRQMATAMASCRSRLRISFTL
jgi:hypothetical protein